MKFTIGEYELSFGTDRNNEECVLVNGGKYTNWKPKPRIVLNWFKELSRTEGDIDKVYYSFIQIYDNVSKDFNPSLMMDVIMEVDSEYESDNTLLWSVLWMNMVLEENNDDCILGKRKEHLMVYNLLFDKYPVGQIISYMKRTDMYELNKLMIEREI